MIPNQMKHYQTRWSSKSSRNKSHIPRTQTKTHRHKSRAARAAGWSLICVSSSHYLLRSVQRKSDRAASAEHFCRSALRLMMVPSSRLLKNYPWLLLNLCQMIRLGLHPRTPLRPSRDSAGRVTASAYFLKMGGIYTEPERPNPVMKGIRGTRWRLKIRWRGKRGSNLFSGWSLLDRGKIIKKYWKLFPIFKATSTNFNWHFLLLFHSLQNTTPDCARYSPCEVKKSQCFPAVAFVFPKF